MGVYTEAHIKAHTEAHTGMRMTAYRSFALIMSMLISMSILAGCVVPKASGEYKIKSAVIEGISYSAQEIEELVLPLINIMRFGKDGNLEMILEEPNLGSIVTINGNYSVKGRNVELDVTKWTNGIIDGKQIVFTADDGDVITMEKTD